MSGEAKSVTPEMIAPWEETTLPTLLSQYDLKDIYNADEFGLFYQCLPSGSLHYKSEKCIGGKHSKVRLTGLVGANAVGEKLPIFVIGKAAKPRCFAGIRNLPCRYRGQKKSWMDGLLFEDWVREIDRKFEADKRKVVLIVDNCPAHPQIGDLKAINLVFLPPNTTSHTQPMDQGVIHSLKAKYRHLVVQKYITSLELKEGIPKISILNAMDMLVSAWSMVAEETVVNCFKKSGISSSSKQQALDEEDDPFRHLVADLQKLQGISQELVPEVVTAEMYANIDADAQTTDSAPHGDDILGEFLDEEIQDSEEANELAEEIADDIVEMRPSICDIRNAIDVISRHCLFSQKGEEIRCQNIKLSSLIDEEALQNLRQVSIMDYFSSI